MIPRNRPQTPAPDCAVLQYASGHTEAKLAGQSRFSPLIGFHVERGKYPDVDQLAEAAHIPLMEIRHPRTGGAPEIKPHWHLGESLLFYPITAGPPATTIAACVKSPATAEAGIGLAWRQGEKSRMAVRGLLVLARQPILVQLAVRSTMTGYLLAALVAHVRACEAADSMIDRAKHPELVALHELGLPLVAGEEVPAGRTETAQIARLESGHPEEITREHVKTLWRPEAVNQAAIAAWPGIQVWAAGYASGETNGDSHMQE